MDEQTLIAALRALPDDPVAPPLDYRDALWARIELALGHSPSPESGVAGGVYVDTRSEVEGSRHASLAGPLNAAAVFAAALSVGVLFLWVRPNGPAPEAADQTELGPASTGAAISESASTVSIAADGAVTLPEGLYPASVVEVGDHHLAVIAGLAPPEPDAPPQETAAVLMIDRSSGEVTWRRDLEEGPSRVVVSDEGLWVAHFRTGRLTKLDPETGNVVGSGVPELPFDVGGGPDGREFIPNDLRVAFGSVWMSTARGAIARFDLDTADVVGVTGLGLPPVYIAEIAAGDHYLWVAAEDAGVYRFDPEGGPFRRLPMEDLGHRASTIHAFEEAVVVAGDDGGGQTRISVLDPEAMGPVARLEVESEGAALRQAGDQLLLGSREAGSWVFRPLRLRPLVLGPELSPIASEGSFLVDGPSQGALWLVDPHRRTLTPLSSDWLARSAVIEAAAPRPDESWRVDGVGMADSSVASIGRLVLADDEHVYVADGFTGEGGGSVRAIDSAGGIVWARDDLAAEDPGEDVFLQALVGNSLIVSAQHGVVRAVDSATGQIQWDLPLPDGYGAVGAVYAGDTLVVATDAPREGDVRPPAVYGLDPEDGSIRWRTELAEGTDLQWHPPAAGEGAVVLNSTLSHPGSALGNMVHALDPDTGDVLWRADLGGDQGFHKRPSLVHGERVFVPAPDGGMVALALADGSRLWDRPSARPLAIAPDGRVLAAEDRRVVLVDPRTGDRFTLIPTIDSFVLSATVRGDQLIVTSAAGVAGYDLEDGDLLWRWASPAGVSDLPAVADESVAIPLADRSVVRIEIPPG